jgi:hypothetical protein
LPHRRKVNPFRRLLDEFIQKMYRQVSVNLKIFDRLLTRDQGVDLWLKGRNVLDLHFQLLDLSGQELIALLLR